MTKTLTIGRTYAVTTSGTCDVTDANGTLITTANAGQQVVFVAPTTTVTFSDDAASVVAVFNLALAKTRLFEQLGEGRLPAGYLPARFLESTGGQWVDTGLGFNQETRLELQCAILKLTSGPQAVILAGSFRDATRALTITQKTYQYNVNARFGAQAASAFDYYLPSLGQTVITTAIDKKALTLNGIVQHAWATADYWESNAGDSLFLFKGNGDTNNQWASQELYIYSANITNNGILQGNYMPALDAQGVPCMYEKVTTRPFYNVGSGSFIVGMTAAQARALGKLSADAPTKTLTVSLPAAIVDGGTVTDAAVQAALDAAAAKGWTITIQTYTD